MKLQNDLIYSTLAPTFSSPLHILFRPCLTRFQCYFFDPIPLPLSLEVRLCPFDASRLTPIPRVSPVSRASEVQNWHFYRFPGRPPKKSLQFHYHMFLHLPETTGPLFCPYILQLLLHPFSCALLMLSSLLGPSGLPSLHFGPYFQADHRDRPLSHSGSLIGCLTAHHCPLRWPSLSVEL